jgi:hypothetical protein
MTPSWIDHIDIVQVIFGAGWLYFTWSATRYIDSQSEQTKTMTEELKVLHGRITDAERILHSLVGAHKAIHCKD